MELSLALSSFRRLFRFGLSRPKSPESLLSQISLGDIVRCVVMLKDGEQGFRESKLSDGLKWTSNGYPYLRGLFEGHTGGDGISPSGKTSPFGSTMANMQASDLIYRLPNHLNTDYYLIREDAKPVHKKLIHDGYEFDPFRIVRPIACILWSR